MKILLIMMSQELKETIRLGIQGVDASREVKLINASLDSLDTIAEREHPDVIIMDEIATEESQLKTLEQFGLYHRDIALIILCGNYSSKSEFLMAAMHCGVEDVLQLPLVMSDLQKVVNRIEARLMPANKAQNKGKVIAFVSSKGGSGVTFLAGNISYLIAQASTLNVALLDLNLQFGDAMLSFSDIKPANTLADVAENISRLDASLLKSAMVQVLPNFSVLAAPESLEQSLWVKPEHIAALLELARLQYDHVMLDIGQPFSETSIKALDYADMILIVLEESLPFIRDSQRLINAYLSLGLPKSKIHLLVNKYENSKRISIKDIEENLGLKVFKIIPRNDELVSSSIDQGVSIIKLAKHDKVTKALQDITQELTEGVPVNEGWLDHIFN